MTKKQCTLKCVTGSVFWELSILRSSVFTRDTIYAIACILYMPRQFRLSVRTSVCPSVTRVYCIKTAECIIEILSLSDRPIILVFRHQRLLRKSDGFTPKGGAKYKGGSNFRPICGYISETVINRGIVTMEDEYKVVCALSNSATFDDLEWPQTPVSRSQYSLKANSSLTVHPILSMFGSRQWFWGRRIEWRYFQFDKIQYGGWRPSWNDGAVARNPCVSWAFLLGMVQPWYFW